MSSYIENFHNGLQVLSGLKTTKMINSNKSIEQYSTSLRFLRKIVCPYMKLRLMHHQGAAGSRQLGRLRLEDPRSKVYK